MKQQPQNNFIKIAGISLLELMLSLAIIAILLVAASRYYESTRSAQEVNEAMNMLQNTLGAVDSWYSTFKSFKGTPNGDISIAALAEMGLVPKDFNTPNSNPWNGAIEISPVDNKNIQITLHSVPAADCLNLKEIMLKHNVTGSCTNNNYVISYP